LRRQRVRHHEGKGGEHGTSTFSTPYNQEIAFHKSLLPDIGASHPPMIGGLESLFRSKT
jgi:hypothetical protein